LFDTATGRRILTPHAIAAIEREYLRFGIGGILISRFLPGIRAVVPPFAGLVNLSPLRAGLPIVLASGIWYGGLTLLGAELGAHWDRISAILSGLNRTLAWLAVLVLGAWALTTWLRSRRGRRGGGVRAAPRARGGDGGGPVAPAPAGAGLGRRHPGAWRAQAGRRISRGESPERCHARGRA